MGWLESISVDSLYQAIVERGENLKGYGVEAISVIQDYFDTMEMGTVGFDLNTQQPQLVDDGFEETETEDDDGTVRFHYEATFTEVVLIEFVLPVGIDEMLVTFYPPEPYVESYVYEVFSGDSFDEDWAFEEPASPFFLANDTDSLADLMTICSISNEALVTSFNWSYDGGDIVGYFRVLPFPDVQLKDLWVTVKSDAFTWEQYNDGTYLSYAQFQLALVHRVWNPLGGGYTSTVGVAINLAKAAKVRDGLLAEDSDVTIDYFFDGDFLKINPWISAHNYASLLDAYDNSTLLSAFDNTAYIEDHEDYGYNFVDGTVLIDRIILLVLPTGETL